MQTFRCQKWTVTVVTAVLALVLSLFLPPSAVHAQTIFQNPEFHWVVDIPVGWEVLDAERADFVSFTDPERIAVLQIISFPGDRFVTVQELDSYIRTSFSASGDAVPFRYLGDHSIFADYRFVAGSGGGRGIPVRGYMTFINGGDFDYAVMTFVVEDHYEQLHDVALSALDSFSPDLTRRQLPGPVSAFYTAAADAGDDELPASEIILPSGKQALLPETIRDPVQIDGSQVLIEREARVLAPYAPVPGREPPPWQQAWRRYFRMVYRDNVERLVPVAEMLFHDLASAGVPRDQMPEEILSWLQGAEYRRTPSLSDLMNPLWCLVDFAGDCDSLGLTYAILLHHLGFDAILMVSLEFAHAVVGVDIPGEGARFPFEERQWLVAELTAPVPIGQIDQTMSDITGWVGIKLDPTAW